MRFTWGNFVGDLFGLFLKNSDGSGGSELKGISGSMCTADQSQKLTNGLYDDAGNPKTTATTALPRFANNVNAPTGAASAAAAAIATVQAGDVVSRSWSETDVDGVVVTCWGGSGFAGVYVALAATDIGTTAAAARLTGTSDNGNRQRYWVAKGERVFIPFAGLAYAYLIAMDVDGSEENHVDLVPV